MGDFSQARGSVASDDARRAGIFAGAASSSEDVISVGLGMIYGSPWVYFLAIPFFSFVYLSIVVTEENYLRGRFGAEYEQYCKRVNRFFPNFFGIRKSLEQFHYDWRKTIRKDYGTFFGVLIGCYATLLWKRYYFHGFPRSKSDIMVSAFVFILLGVCYGWIRYLKKTGRLKSPS